METFRRLYDWNERTFWNSLTKKLMSFLILFCVDLAYLGIYFQQKNAVAEEIQRAGSNLEALQRISSSMDAGLTLMIFLTVFALCWNVLQILYIRHLILRPVKMISNIFDEIARGEGDFSRNLPTITHDELRTLAESYNRFADKMRERALEVILVNAKSTERPEKAQAIAQSNLAGGGDAAQGRATSPLPYSALTAVGDDFEEMQRKMDAMQEQQTQLLAQLRRQVAALPPPDPRKPSESTGERAQEERRRQLVKILAEIERRINEENARPKKRYISPSTREAAYAVYYDALRRKVEDKGTENFPEKAGNKIYGELTMIVTVNHDGRVLETEVVQGSGNPLLDHRAQAIARAAGPFGPFTAEMRAKADQIAVVSRFKFTRDQTLETSVR